MSTIATHEQGSGQASVRQSLSSGTATHVPGNNLRSAFAFRARTKVHPLALDDAALLQLLSAWNTICGSGSSLASKLGGLAFSLLGELGSGEVRRRGHGCE